MTLAITAWPLATTATGAAIVLAALYSDHLRRKALDDWFRNRNPEFQEHDPS